MIFYVTWPSIQQGLQIDNIQVNCLCAHTQSVPYIYGSQYIFTGYNPGVQWNLSNVQYITLNYSILLVYNTLP